MLTCLQAATYLAKDLMYVLIAASAEAYVMKAATPDYILHHRISRAILYLYLPNFILFFGYKCFIYPFFYSPFRNLPQPKVRTRVNISVSSANDGNAG